MNLAHILLDISKYFILSVYINGITNLISSAVVYCWYIGKQLTFYVLYPFSLPNMMGKGAHVILNKGHSITTKLPFTMFKLTPQNLVV